MSATNVQNTLLICNMDISYYLMSKHFQTFRNPLGVDPDFKKGVQSYSTFSAFGPVFYYLRFPEKEETNLLNPPLATISLAEKIGFVRFTTDFGKQRLTWYACQLNL